MLRRYHCGVTLLAGVCSASAAYGQTDSSVLIAPAVPDTSDRDRNVSVTERPRPDYDQLGIRRGGLLIFPRLRLAAGGTSNPYLLSGGANGALILTAVPSVQVNSDWARDYASITASSTLNRFVGNARRNESWFDFRSIGRKDIGSAYTITGEGQIGKLYESPTSGAIDPSLAVLSSYIRSYLAVRGQYTVGKGRATLALDRSSFQFNKLTLASGTAIDQGDRDRIITRATGELQYALSPSVSLYGQATIGKIDYSRPLASGAPNRNSIGWRLIGGVNFDLAGSMRGRIGVGYIRRHYRSAAFGNVGGLSVEGEVQFFPNDLNTVTVSVGRTLEDSGVSGNSAYFDNRVSAKLDHELLRNLLIGAVAEYRRQQFIDFAQHANYFRTAATAKYLSSRFFTVDAELGYLRRTSGGTNNGKFNELRGMIGFTIQR